MPEYYTYNKFQKRYIFALSLIALLSLLAFFFLETILKKQEQFGDLINITGRQRMLSQRIMLYSHKLYGKEGKSFTQEMITKRDEALNLFEKSHNDMLDGLLRNTFKVPLSKTVYQYYLREKGINQKVSSFIDKVKNAQSSDDLPTNNEVDTLLIQLDKAVKLIEAENRAYIKKIEMIELSVLLLTLLVLFLEAFFIFAPQNHSIKNLISDLHAKQLEAIKAKKIKSKFISNMTHEIRTPLNGIIGTLNLLEREKLDEKERELIDILDSCSKMTLELINDILDFEKIEANKFELRPNWCDIREMIREIENVFHSLALNKNINFSCELNLPLEKEILIDSLRFRQVLTNITSNAIKFTQEGEVKLKVSLENEILQVIVSDNGVGIAKEHLNQIFNAFEQVYEIRERILIGTGLGLTITKQIIDYMGGTINVFSEIGKGTIFSITIPVESRRKLQGQQVHGQNSTQDQLAKKLHILVVEDNEINQKVISMYLKKLGHSFDMAENGAIGIDFLEKNSYDLVLTDIQMPVMNGRELFDKAIGAKLVEKYQIVALTANANAEDTKNYLEQGFYQVLQKPISLPTLKTFLGDWTQKREENTFKAG